MELFIETTVASYYTAWSSRDVVVQTVPSSGLTGKQQRGTENLEHETPQQQLGT